MFKVGDRIKCKKFSIEDGVIAEIYYMDLAPYMMIQIRDLDEGNRFPNSWVVKPSEIELVVPQSVKYILED